MLRFAVTEVVGPQMRLLCGVLYWSGGTTGILVLALVAYYVRGYPYVMMTAMTATLLLISGCWYVRHEKKSGLE